MTAGPTPLERGAVVWVDLDPTAGREQRGTRPALVVCSADYLTSVRDLVVVLPITSVDRAWPHHVPVVGERSGLPKPSFAMTEQPRTVSTTRITRRSGTAESETMREVDRWLQDFLGLGR
ncbi:type II toxin-antitoxin system PemK/MazF family toxin [Blastococcus sp. CT_GayMR16]|uniref:type II toxin-antitoxin system PemK/MazF family toxin n=1 Tax=Blastococcus sp. CT_GayMR16 TaxID=2559607 RepID=UPI001073C786|nr:type II toxin-antitoxin system PemK/MazF family toxin [Blastococcus sp. CT_GayMR16]TFV90345.1 type II toxin-antitoxin system PemK/MazF family toxin [Blastococcus sp. CT_GayMR16]